MFVVLASCHQQDGINQHFHALSASISSAVDETQQHQR